MYGWRISKYDPRFRNDAGHYLKDEWIGPAQIGSVFADGTLTEQEYRRVEDLYVDAVLRLWTAAGAPPLQIQALETTDRFGLPANLNSLHDVGFQGWQLQNGERITEARLVAAMTRYCLRSFGWCVLAGESFGIRFGYDYYIYISTNGPMDAERKAIVESGLFMEAMEAMEGMEASEFSQPQSPPTDFQIEVIRKDEEVVDHIVPVTSLSANAAIDIWPDVPALAGYRTRRIDAAMADRIQRHVKYDFDFNRFEYWLALVD